MTSIFFFLERRKYEILLFALVQHLYIGIFLNDLPFYTSIIWPFNMLVLGIASIGVFKEKGKWKKIIKNILSILVLFFPMSLHLVWIIPQFMMLLNISYVIFFVFIFWEVMNFLLKPSYIDMDIISASACGYFLLIEMSVFLLQLFVHYNHESFKGINLSNPASIYIDLVYFCSITFTSIGFGDITPNNHQTKLLTSLLGIAGQFYSVVLVGIIISKFTSRNFD